MGSLPYFYYQRIQEHVCQAQLATGDLCNTPMQPDKTGSTKALNRHLNRRHNYYKGTDIDSGIMQEFLAHDKISHVSYSPSEICLMIDHFLNANFELILTNSVAPSLANLSKQL